MTGNQILKIPFGTQIKVGVYRAIVVQDLGTYIKLVYATQNPTVYTIDKDDIDEIQIDYSKPLLRRLK